MPLNDQLLRTKTDSVRQRLLEAYGEPQRREVLPPLDQLIGTILSQNTSDVNSGRAFERLRQRFPSWNQVRDAPVEEVVDAIRSAGLANQKGPRIQKALRRITEERGELSLDFLSDLPLEDARSWLLSFHGVGPKTAAIVLLFSLGRPAFPVDTHVHRVSQRLGLIGERTSAEKAHQLLEAQLSPQWFYAFHLNVVHHGRRVCHARAPECERCVLSDLCNYYGREFADSGSGESDMQ
jgi:endonuclease-3